MNAFRHHRGASVRGVVLASGALVALAHCASSTSPGDARAEVATVDVAPLMCDPDASRCHFMLNFCEPAMRACWGVAQCEAGGFDAGFTAYGICTSGPQVCAQADHCDSDASLPDPATCHCGAGPACPLGAVCVSDPSGAPPACRCIHGT